MLQHYNENMVNNTSDNDPALEHQNEHQQASTVNHVLQELHDTVKLKEKLKTYLAVIISGTSKENYKIVSFQRKQTKRLS